MSVRAWFIVIAIVLAVGGVIAATVVFSGGESPSLPQTETVRIEFRANPTATISIDGKKVATTPINLQFSRSTREISVKATMVRHLVAAHTTKDEHYEDVRTVTLDRDQTIDFKIDKKNLVETPEGQ